MSMHRIGTCSQCGAEEAIIVKRLPSLGELCCDCNRKRLDSNKVSRSAPTRKPTSKPSGEGALFQALWNVRPHKSFITGESLGDEAKTWFFAHVLPKSTYPEMRLYDKNIVFLTLEQHEIWDRTDREEARADIRWDKMFELEEQLKEEVRKIRGIQ
jgi:hypothetical protein